MKSSAWDTKLWQNKMLEIPLEEDIDSAWAGMNSMLNEAMPVTSTSPVVKKLWGIPRSLLLTIAYTAAAAAILILATHYVLKERPDKIIKPQKEQNDHLNKPQSESKIDTALNTTPDSANMKADSSADDKPKAPTDVTPGKTKNAGTGNQGNLSKQPNALAASQTTGSNTLAADVKGKSARKMPNSIGHNVVRSQIAPQGSSSRSNTVNAAHFNNRRNPGSLNTNTVFASTPPSVYSNKDQQADQNPAKTNGVARPAGQSATSTQNKPGNIIAGQTTKPGTVQTTPNKGGDTTKKPPVTTPAIVKNKPAPQTKHQINKQEIYSRFNLGIEAGINTNNKSTVPYAGISAFYAVNSKFSVGTGVNLFSSRIIDGTYTKSKYKYTTQNDSGRITSYTAKVVVNSSQKIYTADIPVIATYKVNRWLSLKGGPVISIPIKKGALTNVLSPVGITLDTARAYKTLLSKVNSTTINSNVNVSLSGGVNINLNRFYINAQYVQGLGAYTTNSSLGAGDTYYHAIQVGIGYKLFKSKPKDN